MTIYDLITSQELSDYWNTLTQNEPPYMGEELFPNNKKLGIDLKWLKGSKGLPCVLKSSGFDTKAIPRDRIAFDKVYAEMPFFKESTYIDEELRQSLNMVLETGNQVYIDAVLTRVFDDEMRLIRSARVSRERMRMQCITSGVVAMASNGQTYVYDYSMPDAHKGEASTSWNTVASSDPIEDMRQAKETIYDNTGNVVTRAVCNTITFRQIRNSEAVKKALYPLTNGVGAINDKMVKDYIFDQLEITVAINDKKYKDEADVTQKFVPDYVLSMFPDGMLGTTWFGTTPAESDLANSSVANVSIIDMGVAVVTSQKVDPVQVETIVSMICLPSFEQADSVFILDTNPS